MSVYIRSLFCTTSITLGQHCQSVECCLCLLHCTKFVVMLTKSMWVHSSQYPVDLGGLEKTSLHYILIMLSNIRNQNSSIKIIYLENDKTKEKTSSTQDKSRTQKDWGNWKPTNGTFWNYNSRNERKWKRTLKNNF